MPGPIQPRFTASTKKKTTPRSVTTPPVKASVLAPISSSAEIVRPQSKPLAGCGAGAPASAAAGGVATGGIGLAGGGGCGGRGGRGGGGGGGAARPRRG